MVLLVRFILNPIINIMLNDAQRKGLSKKPTLLFKIKEKDTQMSILKVAL
jgi:hypothetical protein